MATNYGTSLVSLMCKLKGSLLFDEIDGDHPFFYGTAIISRERLNQSLYQGHCVYFTTLIAAIHYSKRSVVNS